VVGDGPPLIQRSGNLHFSYQQGAIAEGPRDACLSVKILSTAAKINCTKIAFVKDCNRWMTLREVMSREFFLHVSELTYCLRHLLANPKDYSFISRLRTYEKYPRVFTRTNVAAHVYSIRAKSVYQTPITRTYFPTRFMRLTFWLSHILILFILILLTLYCAVVLCADYHLYLISILHYLAIQPSELQKCSNKISCQLKVIQGHRKWRHSIYTDFSRSAPVPNFRLNIFSFLFSSFELSSYRSW